MTQKIFAFLFFIVVFALGAVPVFADDAGTLETNRIHIRDPFILADAGTATYYMYAQSANRVNSGFTGVEVYTSRDLKRWTKPVPVLTLPKELAVLMVWAPEVHVYKGRYYLFVTLTRDDKVSTKRPVARDNWPPMYKRGTWIFCADSPKGPFRRVKDGSHTPDDWMALDGTLWVEKGTPYMIFCHEWVQLVDGTIDLLRLKDDLSDADGKPILLFAASSAPGAVTQANAGKVTDGPYLYKSPKSGSLYMLWSTFVTTVHGYCMLAAKSESGSIFGPWSKSEPVYTHDGGHGMIFTTFEGKPMVAIHHPNIGQGDKERLLLFELIDDGVSLKMDKMK